MTNASLTETVAIGGVKFSALSPEDAVSSLLRPSDSHTGAGVHVHLANAYSVALADQQPELKDVFNDRLAVCFADGKPVTWFSAAMPGGVRLQQVRGPQLFLDAISRSQGTGLKHYLLGGRPEVLERLVTVLSERFPGAVIVGHESPPFRVQSAEELAAQDERILNSKADLVWIGLGTPKQDFEAHRIAYNLPVVALAVGAAFDFAAGTMPEAPGWIRRIGFEWAFRLASEPRRLWRRYTFGSLRFLRAATEGAAVGRRNNTEAQRGQKDEGAA